jgi:hypothetical protein
LDDVEDAGASLGFTPHAVITPSASARAARESTEWCQGIVASLFVFLIRWHYYSTRANAEAWRGWENAKERMRLEIKTPASR